MDGKRFDLLTRTLTAPLARRATLGGFAAGVLLGLVPAPDEADLLAKKKGKKKKKKKKDGAGPPYTGPCEGDCGVVWPHFKNPACCGNSCRDLHADPYNCGACFNHCPRKTKPLCYAGQCRQQCPAGLTKCGNTCFHQPVETCCSGMVMAIESLQHDPYNCGACLKNCAELATATSPPTCCSGMCCDYNYPACCSGRCTNLNGLEPGNTHCGACDTTCKPNETCQLGRCVCPPGAAC